MAEVSTWNDVQDRLSQDGPDAVITFDDGSILRMSNVDSTTLSQSKFFNGSTPSCMAAGTRVRAPGDLHRIETLAVGDLVETQDHGPQPIRAITRQTMLFASRADRARPVLVRAGVMAPGVPFADLILSPQHRVLRPPGVLVPAASLLRCRGTRRMRGLRRVHYLNLLMDQHEVIEAEGLPVETLLLTPLTRPLVARTGPLAISHAAPARPLSRG